MKNEKSFEVQRYDFNARLFEQFRQLHYAKELWPIVYVLSDGTIKEAYVGETADTIARMTSHLKSDIKNKLTAVHLITSEKFNKSATLDIESNLIKYISGDGQFKLINGNIGLANHNYYQKKEVYWDIFQSIWEKLRSEGISRHSIEYINNSDLFKYSPYKTLGQDQKNGLITIIKGLLDPGVKTILVDGGAGTGKSILAVFLFKMMHSDNDTFNYQEFGDDEMELVELVKRLKEKFPKPKMALVVPMSSFRNTIKKVFRNIKGLNANMVIGPAEITKGRFDIVVVDESHRLRRRVNLGAYYGKFDIACEKLGLDRNTCSELDWILQQAANSILFYDENQSIKPSDAKKSDFDRLKTRTDTRQESLRSQFRVRGGTNYVEYINRLLRCSLDRDSKQFNSKDYQFLLFDSLEDLVREINLRNGETQLSRLIAGYSWPWISKTDKATYDINIGNVHLQWNAVSDDWVNSKNSINEVGCIHTTQGYDLNYGGIIFGNEISYDKATNQIVILKENYFDKNGKNSITDPQELKDFIINIYKTILLRSIKGTYVYVCDKNLREYFAEHIPKYQSSILKATGLQIQAQPFDQSVPLYDLKAAAGSFSELQNNPSRKWIEVPARYKSADDLFACTVVGESMNKVIPNGSICLFRKYTGGSRNGRIVLVELTGRQDPDFGSSYTVKEYHSTKIAEGEEWRHETIILKPLSSNKDYHNIEIGEDELNELKVNGIFECVLR